MMPQGDAVRTYCCRHPFQKFVAYHPGHIFRRSSRRLFPRLDIRPLHCQRHRPAGTQLPDETFFRLRFPTEAVIEMRGGHGDSVLLSQHPQHRKEGHGIRTPGQGHEDRITVTEQGEFFDGLPDLFQHGETD